MVVALDKSTLEFSSFVLPDEQDWNSPASSLPKVALSVGRDGKARIVVHEAGDILKVFARLRGGGKEWALEKTIQLSAAMLGLTGLRWL